MRKVKACDSCKVVTTPKLQVVRCILPRHHDDEHTNGELTW